MGVSLIPFRFPSLAGVGCAFQKASAPMGLAGHDAAERGSISLTAGLYGTEDRAAVIANREALREACGLKEVAEVQQVHGTVTLFEPEAQDLSLPPLKEADGLAASRAAGHEERGLMIKMADCQAILIAHKSGNYIMGIHAGWRGNRQGYPRLAVEEFCDHYRLLPRDLFAVRGPSLGPGCAEFTRFDEEWGGEYLPFYDRETRCMDLWRLTRHQLAEAGLPSEHIYGLDLCTRRLCDDFFSYRADRLSGRQAALIWFVKQDKGADQTINI